MQINNINASEIQALNNIKKPTVKGVPQAQQIELPKIELPDIRSNQILLPDNKIYVPQGSQPADFNKNNISVQLPKNFEEVERTKESFITRTARQMYKKFDVKEYHNTQTDKNYIRATKNEFTEDGILNSAEVMQIDLKKPFKGTRYIEDYEHNTVTEIKLSQPLVNRKTVIESVTTLQKDDNGKVVKKEEYTQSPLKGVYDIVETDATGKKNVLSKTTKNADGSYVIEKHLTSLDGTKTEYRMQSDKDGNHRAMYCQITAADGKVLSTIDRTFDKEGNVTECTLNGNKYTTKREGKDVTVLDHTKNEMATMNSETFAATPETKAFLSAAAGNRQYSNADVADQLFDELPTDTLFTMYKNISEIVPLKDDLDSAFVSIYDYLMCRTDNFVINHELGHSKDAKRVPEDANLMDKEVVKDLKKDVIAGTKDFRAAYTEEKAAFIKAFPDYKEKMVAYFIFSPDKKPQRGRKETVAESNAINGLAPQSPVALGMRTTLLQQYFPRSIAEATKLMNPIAMVDLEQSQAQPQEQSQE